MLNQKDAVSTGRAFFFTAMRQNAAMDWMMLALTPGKA